LMSVAGSHARVGVSRIDCHCAHNDCSEGLRPSEGGSTPQQVSRDLLRISNRTGNQRHCTTWNTGGTKNSLSGDRHVTPRIKVEETKSTSLLTRPCGTCERPNTESFRSYSRRILPVFLRAVCIAPPNICDSSLINCIRRAESHSDWQVMCNDTQSEPKGEC